MRPTGISPCGRPPARPRCRGRGRSRPARRGDPDLRLGVWREDQREEDEDEAGQPDVLEPRQAAGSVLVLGHAVPTLPPHRRHRHSHPSPIGHDTCQPASMTVRYRSMVASAMVDQLERLDGTSTCGPAHHFARGRIGHQRIDRSREVELEAVRVDGRHRVVRDAARPAPEAPSRRRRPPRGSRPPPTRRPGSRRRRPRG